MRIVSRLITITDNISTSSRAYLSVCGVPFSKDDRKECKRKSFLLTAIRLYNCTEAKLGPYQDQWVSRLFGVVSQ